MIIWCGPSCRWYLLILWEGRRIQPLCGGRGTGLFPDSCVARRLRILIRALLAPRTRNKSLVHKTPSVRRTTLGLLAVRVDATGDGRKAG